MDNKVIKDAKPEGNDFQFKVKKVLIEAGWDVRMSPHYNDSFSEKPREIDMIAEKAFLPRSSDFYSSTVIVRLVIECKYVAEDTTFWLDERNINKAKEIVKKSRVFHDPNTNTLVVQKHHYLADSLIAKLYKTDGKNNTDGDPVYKAINQCLNAYIYFRNQPTTLKRSYDYQSMVEISYPIIVCSSFDRYFKKDTTTDYEIGKSLQISEPFQIEVDYAYSLKDKQFEELFYIDVINVNGLQNFEDKILLGEIDLAKQKIYDDKREAEYNSRIEQVNNGNFDTYSAM